MYYFFPHSKKQISGGDDDDVPHVSPIVWWHLLTAVPALVLGAIMVCLPKGNGLGRVWVFCTPPELSMTYIYPHAKECVDVLFILYFCCQLILVVSYSICGERSVSVAL